jgi:flagellar M-ring protein FliF
MDKLLAFWNATTTGSRILAAGALSLFCAGVVALSIVGGQVNYVPLFSGLAGEDAGKVIEKLRERKIPYRIGGGGGTIEVPESQVHELRMTLAASGVPGKGVVGFEVFDSLKFGLSGFGEKIQYRRALEGELGRTVSHLQGVRSGRVHIALPEPTLYGDESAAPTASVILDLEPGATLDRGQMAGITHLVAAAVEGLRPESVSVVDTSGRLLSGAGVESGMGDLRGAVETALEKRAQTLLERIYGQGRVMVRVQADLDAEKMDATREIFETGAAANGIVRSLQETTESSSGTDASAGGVPAAESLGGSKAGGGGGKSQSSHTQRTVSYEINKRLEHLLKLPGGVKRLSAAVVIGQEKMEPAELARVKTMVEAALGIDAKRGDVLVVEAMKLKDATLPAPDTAGTSRVEKLWLVERSLRYGSFALGALLLFWLGLSMVRGVKSIDLSVAAPVAQTAALPPAGAPRPSALPLPARGESSPRSVGDLRQELNSMLNKNPGAVEKTMGDWLAQSEKPDAKVPAGAA